MAKRNKSKKIEEALERLVALSETEAKDRDAKKKKAEELNKKQEDAKKSLKNLPGIKQLLAFTGAEMTKSLKASFKLQERGLARGMNLGQHLERNAATISHLDSNLQGYAGAVDTSMEMFESGLRNNNKEIATLGALTKITGGNSKKLLGQLAKNTAGLGISQEGMSSLATATASMSQNYGVTTGELMDSLDGLKDQLSSFGALGIGAEMQEAGVRISAALGPAAAHLGPKLLGAFTKGSSMVQSSILGISKQRERLLNKEGNMTKNAFDLVITAGENSKKIIKQFTRGARDPAFALQKATELHGTQLLEAKMAYDAMDAQAKKRGMNIRDYAKLVSKEKDVSKKFTETWENLKNMVLGPLQKAFIFVGGGILKVFGWIQKVPALKSAIQLLIGAIAGWIAFMKAKQATGILKHMMGIGGGATKAAAGAAGGAGKVGGGMMKGLGGGLKGLGAGLKAMGGADAMKGAVTIGILALSLIPLAFALNMMKGVGWETFFILAAGMTVLTAAFVAVGMMASSFGPFLVAGAGAFAIMAIALIPLAYAMNLAAPAADMFIVSLAKVGDIPLMNLLGLAVVLPILGLALLYFSVIALKAGLISGIGSLFGVKSPFEQLALIAKSAPQIINLADALFTIPKALSALKESLNNLSEEDMAKLHAIGMFSAFAAKGAVNIKSITESITSTNSSAQDEQVQLLKKAVERLESINDSLDGANEQRSTANSQRNEQVQNTKTRPTEMRK